MNLSSKHFIGEAEVDLNKMIITLNNKNKRINVSEKKIMDINNLDNGSMLKIGQVLNITWRLKSAKI